MTIEEIRSRKRALVQSITNLILNFEKSTKTTVSRIDLRHDEFGCCGAEPVVVLTEVNVRLEGI